MLEFQMKEFWKTVNTVTGITSRVTDWFLMVIGLVLVAKAILAVDVLPAKLLVGGLGLFFSGAGFWYRYRRKKTDGQRAE